jgi:hypothetical protein
MRPLIAEVVREVLAQLASEQAKLGDGNRICFSEPEAAVLLGLNEHCLRDERRRGRITASAIVGRRIRYRRQDLERYLIGRQVNGNGSE